MSQILSHCNVVHVIFDEFAKRSCHNVCNVISRLQTCKVVVSRNVPGL